MRGYLLPETEKDRTARDRLLKAQAIWKFSQQQGRERKEEIRKRHKQITKENTARLTREYRARKLDAKINDLTTEQWQFILKAHSYKCWYCLKHYDNLTQDHIIPLSKGGNHTQDNIVPACRSCNSEKGDKTVTEYFEYICGKW